MNELELIEVPGSSAIVYMLPAVNPEDLPPPAPIPTEPD